MSASWKYEFISYGTVRQLTIKNCQKSDFAQYSVKPAQNNNAVSFPESMNSNVLLVGVTPTGGPSVRMSLALVFDLG